MLCIGLALLLLFTIIKMSASGGGNGVGYTGLLEGSRATLSCTPTAYSGSQIYRRRSEIIYS